MHRAISDSRVNAVMNVNGLLALTCAPALAGMHRLTSSVIDSSRTRCTTITLLDARSDSSRSNTAAKAPG
ncbi:hypothetical protein D3C75_1228200 [compost metagenome]